MPFILSQCHCRSLSLLQRALSITGGARVATGYDRSGLSEKRVLNLGGGYCNLV